MFFEKKSQLFVGQFARLYGSDVVLHAFSTRKEGVSQKPFDTLNLGDRCGDDEKNVQENRHRFFQSLGIKHDELAIPVQIHGNHILQVTTPGIYPETDGLITDVPGICLVIQVADCLPIYLYDPVHRAIGLIHAGWRGSARKIVVEGLSAMKFSFKSRAEDLSVFLGPSIGPCCYEVGTDVSNHFPENVMQGNRLNLWKMNQNLLIESGVSPDNITVSGLCTACYSDWFFSHRKSGGKTGRMMGIIGLKERT
jgi:YfiH family protein